MKSILADQEDQREILRAMNVIYETINKNELTFAYVMEALQSLYASYASNLVSYEDYCKKMDIHKESFRNVWSTRNSGKK